MPQTDKLPRARARWHRQRYRLREAVRAVPTQRRRSTDDPVRVVLVALVSRLAPVPMSGGWISSLTGLPTAEVAQALRVLEDEGVLAPGSIASGRGDFTTDMFLSALGIEELSLGWDVLPDQPPSGTHVELTDEQIAEAFGNTTTNHDQPEEHAA